MDGFENLLRMNTLSSTRHVLIALVLCSYARQCSACHGKISPFFIEFVFQLSSISLFFSFCKLYNSYISDLNSIFIKDFCSKIQIIIIITSMTSVYTILCENVHSYRIIVSFFLPFDFFFCFCKNRNHLGS
jgi:hypothetical protein